MKIITNREDLHGAQRQIAELEEILDEMKRTETPEAYAILCKSYVHRIRQIRREIDEYLGISSVRVGRTPITPATGKTP